MILFHFNKRKTLIKNTIPQIKMKKAIKYSKNSERVDIRESLKISKTEDGLELIDAFNQKLFVYSKIAKVSSGEW